MYVLHYIYLLFINYLYTVHSLFDVLINNILYTVYTVGTNVFTLGASNKLSTINTATTTTTPPLPPAATTAPGTSAVTEEGKRQGLVLFWSPRNPEYPEKILYTPHGVTAIAFSKFNPLIFAVG